MQAVSTAWETGIAATTRHTYGRARIDFMDTDLDGTMTISASESADPDRDEQIANGEDDPAGKFFDFGELDGLTAGYTFLPTDPDVEVGWWSESFSTVSAVFTSTITLNVISMPRPVRGIRVYGDIQRNEWPEEFYVRFYDEADLLLKEYHITGNNSPHFDWELGLDAENGLLHDENENILQTVAEEDLYDETGTESEISVGVAKQQLEIVKWSHAGRRAKISQFYSAVIEELTGDNIVSMSVTEQREIQSGTLPIGNIAASELTIRLNNIDNRYDAGNTSSRLYGLLRPNRRVTIWMGQRYPDGTSEEVPMGVFYTKDWNVPETEVYAETTARDVLDMMTRTRFNTGTIYEGKTVYELAEEILRDYGLTTAQYTIDTALNGTDYIVPYAYYEPATHRECLRKTVESVGGYAYVSRTGDVTVEGPSFIAGASEKTLTLDDLFSKSNPVRWESIANRISVPLTPLELGTGAETIFGPSEPQEIGAATSVVELVYYNESPCMSAVATISATESVTSTVTAAVSISDAVYYTWGASITISSNATATSTYRLSIDGLVLRPKNRVLLTEEDSMSIMDNGTIQYTLPENSLIQTRAMARAVAQGVLASYKDARRDISTTWRGDPALELGDVFTAPDYKNVNSRDYYVTALSHDLDETGLTCKMEGRRV